MSEDSHTVKVVSDKYNIAFEVETYDIENTEYEYIKLKDVAEAIGIELSWVPNGENSYAGITVESVVGDSATSKTYEIYIDKVSTCDKAPISNICASILNDSQGDARTFVPIEFLNRVFNFDVVLSESGKKVYLDSGEKAADYQAVLDKSVSEINNILFQSPPPSGDTGQVDSIWL